MTLRSKRAALAWIIGMPFLLLLTACIEGVEEQPQVEPLELSTLFADLQSARPAVANTVPRKAELEPDWLTTGRQNGELIETAPLSMTEELLTRGQEQYNVYCATCHGLAGFGHSVVVERGFPRPPSFHTVRLRQSPDGYYFDVISNGFGRMFSYAPQIEPADRWAVIAYIRALQLSQHAPLEMLTEEELEQIREND